MVDFTFYAPTKVVLGKEKETEVGTLVAQQKCTKVLLHYGGSSAQKSGLLDRVKSSLEKEGITYVELGGVVPNPRLSLVRQGIELCKKENVDFILAVGGGSVIDSAKAIGYGAVTDKDVWSFYTREETPETCLPVGAVLTIAAAGSEMSNSSVITNEEVGQKRGLRNDMCRCKFAVLNPELTYTLPAYQTACGCADILMHTLERYFTPEFTMQITDGIAEQLMCTVIENARILTRNPEDYEARAEIMWCGSLSHNDLTSAGGGPGDWAVHQLSHELSAKYDLAHGAALTAVWGSWARYVYLEEVDRFARLAEKVLDLPYRNDAKALALAGIEEMEGFFWSLDLPTSLAEAEIYPSAEELKELAVRCTYSGTRTIGAIKALGEKEILDIYTNALGES